jgi:GNAT superfamily N-acetyltransferase
MPALEYRVAVPADAAECIAVRGKTRQNAISAERLAAMGITAESWSEDIKSGSVPGHVCVVDGSIVGYGFGNRDSGEVVVLALLPAFEAHGIGKELLSRVVRDLRSFGHDRLFLGCAKDPSTRSHGFYRHLGWRPTGTFDAHDDEVLELLLPQASLRSEA